LVIVHFLSEMLFEKIHSNGHKGKHQQHDGLAVLYVPQSYRLIYKKNSDE
jgi:hypothetical protein